MVACRQIAPSKTLEEKEAFYASLRSRIMGSESEDELTVSNEDIGFDKLLETDRQDDEKGKSTDINTALLSNRNKATPTKTALKTPPSAETSQRKSCLPPTTAIPLMSIPTAALSLPTSLDRDSNNALNCILPPSRQSQVPLLGAPQASSCFLPKLHRNSVDIPLSRGFPSSPKMFGSFVPPPVVAQPSQPHTSLSSTTNLSQQSNPDKLIQHYQMLNCQLLYPQIAQQYLQNQNQSQQHTPIQQVQQSHQSFIPPVQTSLGFEAGMMNHQQHQRIQQSYSQGILQAPAFYQPTTR